MKDIKVKKISINKTPEAKPLTEESAIEIPKKSFSTFSVFLFGLMTTSIVCYVFMISSSIFYAVKASQYEFKGENISGIIVNTDMTEISISKNNSERISYINQDSDTAITLK